MLVQHTQGPPQSQHSSNHSQHNSSQRSRQKSEKGSKGTANGDREDQDCVGELPQFSATLVPDKAMQTKLTDGRGGSQVFSGNEEQTLGSTLDIAKTTNFTKVAHLGEQRSHSHQPQPGQHGGLPQLAGPNASQLTKFQAAVYNRNFILNIDNNNTNRSNRQYLSTYYKQLANEDITPNNDKMAYQSLRSFNTPQRRRGSFLQHERILNCNSEVKDVNFQFQQEMQPSEKIMANTISNDKEIKLPSLVQDNSILTSLHGGIQLSAKAKAAKLINATERKKHRKDVTLALMGLTDGAKSDYSDNRPFKAIGTLEKGFDSNSDVSKASSKKSESLINSSVFNVLEENYEAYLDDIEKEKELIKKKNLKVRNKLIPAERLKFDADEDFARQKIAESKMKKDEDDLIEDNYSVAESEVPEPERNFEKLRARLKLKAIKKLDEENKRVKQAERRAAEQALKGEQGVSDQKRRVHPPIKRRRSFTECQLKFEDGFELYTAEKANNRAHTLTDKATVINMEKAGRWPLPEQIMNKPEQYWLKIDSLLHSIYDFEAIVQEAIDKPQFYKKDERVPVNSEVSSDNLSLGGWTDDEEETVETKKEEKKLVKGFDTSLIALNPFKLDRLNIYPHKAVEGQFPFYIILQRNAEYLLKIMKGLEEQQKLEKHQLSREQLQEVFDYYCDWFKVESIDLSYYILPCENEKIKLSFRSVLLSDNLLKALACTIPFIHDIFEVEFVNNAIQDFMSAILLISAFIAPSVKRFSYVGNWARRTFERTFRELCVADRYKLMEINVSRSINQVEIFEAFSRSLSVNLVKLNISGCDLSLNSCRIMNIFLLKQQNIKDFNCARCKLSAQGARYIIDALNRNSTIRHLNVSYNDFTSSVYEFSIKLAAMLTRHPTLLHCDMTMCGFRREECMFIILAMSLSKSFLALHLTGNDLPYYERVFMRSLVAARIAFAVKPDEKSNEIRLNKERYQIMHMAGGKENMFDELQQYLKTYDKLEEDRQGLDFEITDLMEQIDMEKQYQDLQTDARLEDVPEGSQLMRLINKMVERTHDLDKQQEQVKDMLKMTGPEIKMRLRQLSGEAVENQLDQQLNGNDVVKFGGDFDLKDRQRRRAEMQALKQKKDRGAGEMALLFMGINQVAFDLLIENPMTGYMNDIVYSRILGHDDIELSNYWTDTTQCYICQKWEKAIIRFDPRVDVSKWAVKINQVNNLKQTVDTLYTQAEEVELIKRENQKQEEIQNLEFELARRKALGTYDSDEEAEKLKKRQSKQNDAQSEKSDEKIGFTTLKPKKVQAKEAIKRGVKLKVNLKPQDELNQTQTQLKNVGPSVITAKFGGNLGITPNKKEDTRKINAGSELKKPKIVSGPDGGELTKALELVPRGAGDLPVPRLDTPLERATRPNRRGFNTEDPLLPQPLNIQKIQKKIFPEQFINANDFQELHLAMSEYETDDEGPSISYQTHDHYMMKKKQTRYGGPPRSKATSQAVGGFQSQFGQKMKQKQEQKAKEDAPSMTDIARQAMIKNESTFQARSIHSPATSIAPSVMTSIQKFETGNRRGQAQKVQRTLIFQGMVYVIEEEMYSDSDNSSVYTSEDDFEEKEDMAEYYGQLTHDYEVWMAEETERKKNALNNPEMTEAEKRRQKLLGIVSEKHRKLTKEQEEYKTKIWPKYYVPHLKEEKSAGLDKVGTELELRIGGKRVNSKNKIIDRGPETKSGPLENANPTMYIVGSFNDWMPVRLKTMRELAFEKINPEEPIPKHAFVMDNTLQMYANFMSPGKHYFYFVREDHTIVLSPNYEINRFKTTNVFLNSIVVKPKMIEFDQISVVKGGFDEEEVFLKDKSVFKDFRDDTKQYLKKCFDQDIEYTKLSRAMKKDEQDQLEDTIAYLWTQYIRLNNIFLFYIGYSTYPTIGLNDFTSWSKNCNFIDDKWVNMAALDRILITTNVAIHGKISNAERDLNRYEFLELIVRMANALYKESKVCATTPEAVKKLLEVNIYPNSKFVDGEKFRRFNCYNVKVNELLKKNEPVLKKVYESYTHAKKKFITYAECKEYMVKTELPISQIMVGVIFAESMQTLIDTISDQERPAQMKFVEFLVFLCRIAYQNYVDTPYETEHMYLKLEKCMAAFLLPLQLTPLFLFYEDFEYKPPKRKQKIRKPMVVTKRTVAVKAGEESPTKVQQEAVPEEDESEEDETSEEDMGEVVIIDADKYTLDPRYIAKREREAKEKEKKKAEKLKAREERAKRKAEAAEKRRKEAAQAALLADDGDSQHNSQNSDKNADDNEENQDD